MCKKGTDNLNKTTELITNEYLSVLIVIVNNKNLNTDKLFEEYAHKFDTKQSKNKANKFQESKSISNFFIKKFPNIHLSLCTNFSIFNKKFLI